jgi:hypothetical protein
MLANNAVDINTDTDSNNTDTPLDDTWLRDWQHHDRAAAPLYEEPLYAITVHLVYVSATGDITQSHNITHILAEPNCLRAEELQQLVCTHTTPRHRPDALWMYLYDVPLLQHVADGRTPPPPPPPTWRVLTGQEDVFFPPTPRCFHSLQSLTLLFREVPTASRMTRRHRPTPAQGSRRRPLTK